MDDVFSLGLTILHAATLFDLSYLYNFNNFTLDYTLLNRLLAEAGKRY